MTGHGNRWDEASIVAAIREFADENGRPPTAEEWKRGGPHPSYGAVVRACGSWAQAVEAAGFPRPRQGVYAVADRHQKRGRYRGCLGLA